MTEERPIKTWKQIAVFLDVHEDTARKYIKPFVFYIGKSPAIFPSKLKELAENGKLSYIKLNNVKS